MKRRTPNFFIVGAPKCGTTAMRNYLYQHPDVFFSVPEEPGYFDRNLRYTKSADLQFSNIESYHKIYNNASVEKIIGEGSVYIMYSIEALQEIIENYNDVKFVVMLRNPIDAAISMHGENLKPLKIGREPLESFIDAWYDRASRSTLSELSSVHPFKFRYDELYNYYPYVKTLVDTVGRDNCKFILYEDFKNDNMQEFRNLCSFLGINENVNIQIEKVNERSQVRVNYISKLIFFIAKLARRSKMLNRFRGRGWTLNRFTQKKLEKPVLPQSLNDEMQDFYYRDLDKLESITNLKLREIWTKLRAEKFD